MLLLLIISTVNSSRISAAKRLISLNPIPFVGGWGRGSTKGVLSVTVFGRDRSTLQGSLFSCLVQRWSPCCQRFLWCGRKQEHGWWKKSFRRVLRVSYRSVRGPNSPSRTLTPRWQKPHAKSRLSECSGKRRTTGLSR